LASVMGSEGSPAKTGTQMNKNNAVKQAFNIVSSPLLLNSPQMPG
jgi:hypothetical protein